MAVPPSAARRFRLRGRPPEPEKVAEKDPPPEKEQAPAGEIPEHIHARREELLSQRRAGIGHVSGGYEPHQQEIRVNLNPMQILRELADQQGIHNERFRPRIPALFGGRGGLADGGYAGPMNDMPSSGYLARGLDETLADYVRRAAPDHELVLSDELFRLVTRDREFTNALHNGHIDAHRPWVAYLRGMWRGFKSVFVHMSQSELASYVTIHHPDLVILTRDNYEYLLQQVQQVRDQRAADYLFPGGRN